MQTLATIVCNGVVGLAILSGRSRKEEAGSSRNARTNDPAAATRNTNAQRELSIAYEGFDYPAGSELLDQAGGMGFADAWQLGAFNAGTGENFKVNGERTGSTLNIRHLG